jgi:adenine-specific DNA-methyltransferase
MSIEKIQQGDELTQSKDLVSGNITKLKELFPEIITENKIDLKILRDVLGDEIDEEEEYYRFTWAGKTAARREAHKLSTGTLRPVKEESVDWDTTQNLYIEGDNLEVLKLLQKSYSGKVKMIYADPPYNTGNDFVYKDNYKDNLKNYKEITGQVDYEGNKLTSNSESDGRFHSNWLNMMLPRLVLARNLLKDDGVIFISIDDNEVENLTTICNDVFGESNFIAKMVRKTKLTSNKGTFFAPSHEYILVFAKKKERLNQFNDEEAQSEKSYTDLFKYEDEYSKYNIVGLYQPSLDSRPNQRYFIECPDGSFVIPPGETLPTEVYDGAFVKPKGNEDKVWRWSYDSYLKYDKNNLVFKETKTSPLIDNNGKQAKWNVYTKIYLKDRLEDGARPVTLITKYPNSEASKELIKLKIPFDFSKPKNLIKYLIKIQDNKEQRNQIILDFFSGSATTAHAVMQLNAEDGGNRRHIQIQLPEPTSEKSDAHKAGYKTIADLGKERIRKAAQIIKNDNPLLTQEIDFGFKVFKLDNSNIKGWDGKPENLEQSLYDAVTNIKESRTEEDILYEILLKYGLNLTLPIDERSIEGKKVFCVGLGALFICLSENITNKVAEGIGKWKEELNPEVCRVIFKDTGFTDVEKTNSVQTLKRYGIEEIKSI